MTLVMHQETGEFYIVDDDLGVAGPIERELILTVRGTLRPDWPDAAEGMWQDLEHWVRRQPWSCVERR